ncbi:MAG: prolipoprotein diacylglyceryl transferase [Spirochaetes bacterium]|nr:prolipoprotein diacylglyceryl transferase [Spirochaetota bacterium]
MFPILFQYKFITIGGYGIMLGIGFYLSFLLLEREYKLKNINPDLAYKILLIAIPGGIVGSKIFHILEHLDDFANDPVGMIFSGSGLSVYGGYIFSFLLAIFVIRYCRESIIKIFDATSPSLALGYCFGRFGCHVAGDGCYGIDTTGFWATAYPNGIVPSTATVYPTPLFEVFFSFIAVGLLLNLRKLDLKPGILFSTYLILSGVPRFLVEFIRRNPEMAFGLSQAQIVGIIFTLCGIAGWIYFSKRPQAAVS